MMQPPTELPPVDLLETALRWLGLREARRHVSVHLQARFGADAAGRLPVEQHGLCDAAQGWRFRMAEGSLPEGGQVLLLLRECHGDAAQDALMLATFLEHHAGVDMSRFARLYVNGVVDGVQVALAGAAVSLRSLEGLLADPSLVQAGI